MERQNLFALAQQYTATQRNLVQRTVETYNPHWLVVHETLQNAIDAIQKSSKDEGNVTINLNVSDNRVVTRDDGCGFPHEISLLLMGGGDKADDPEAWKYGGNQGVGLKAVYFSSSLFRLESVKDGKRWGAAIENGHRYMTEDIILSWDEKPEPANRPNGTQVLVEFPGTEVADFLNSIYRDYSHLVPEALATSAAERLRLSLEYYFRNYSYAGDVNYLLDLQGLKPIIVTLTISVDPDALPDILDPQLEELLVEESGLEVTFSTKHWDVEEIIGRFAPRRRKPSVLKNPLESGRIGRFNPNYIWVQKITSPEEYQTLLTNPHMYRPPDISSYDSLFDKVSGIYIVIGQPERLREVVFEGPRQFVAANGIPSAHSIHTPSGIGALGYVANVHMVVNVRANMNYGKQTITNTRLVGEVNRFFKDSFRATLKNVAEGIVGRVEGGSSAEDMALDEEETDILTRPSLPLSELSFRREPRDENGVIAIFFELLGKGHLTGYHVYSLSQKARYDGKGVMKLINQNRIATPKTDASLRNIEFKLYLRPLVAEFSQYIKDSSDVTLIVVWGDDFSERDMPHPDFQVIGIEHTAQADKRMDGVTKVLLDARNGKEIQMLVLKEVVERIASESAA